MKTGQRRMVHLSIWGSDQISKLSLQARLLYIGLIVLGDDEGRLKADPRLVRSQIFPYDDEVKVSDVEKWMREIIAQNLVVEYVVDEVKYMFHPKWEDYQQLREDRRRDSSIPAPLFEFSPMTTKRQPKDNQTATERPHKLSKVKLSKGNTHTVESDINFTHFWQSYPKKVGRKAAWKSWQKLEWTPELGVKIMRGLEVAKQSEQWSKDNGRYIPHAATWLNGERWEDEMAPAKARSAKYDHVGTTTRT